MKATTILIIALIASIFVINNTDGQQIWDFCTGNVNAVFDIEKLTVDPDPPVIGQSATVYLAGTLNEEVTGGTSSMAIQYFFGGSWRALPVFHGEVCKMTTCPVPAGPFLYNYTLDVPFITPQGQYKGVLQVFDQNNKNITCLTFNTTLSR
ncbi:hypothetical protein DLAC_05581 [Tieghemostelium lacteum]|uniref:MD-2-related lipid-recognition domain-containing protein n=1 Tax=Tieghemostelium lacteum TaxID=361077 RepID=A0A151ZG77_TIELA|nr:hypothetical protein DLAC_05581 [Tieghemostelium lacteum]|eukprot:KYQ92978.1 hypothetical protein DLAC_05581 [Tieghemostelium lacteum]